jgi:hypothetical protein
LNPSLFIQFYEKPNTEEEKQRIKSGLQNTFGGARKAGKAMVNFADGKDFAPTVTQLEPNKLDKTFLSLTDTIQRQLCYAHQIDPQLLGLKTPGSLGNSCEMETSYRIFNATVIQPAQKDLENIFNELIAINRLATKIQFVEADIYQLSNSQATAPSSGNAAANSIEAQAKANLKGSVGGVQGILEIQKSVSSGITDYSAALAILDLIYGINEADAKRILGTPVSTSPTTLNK